MRLRDDLMRRLCGRHATDLAAAGWFKSDRCGIETSMDCGYGDFIFVFKSDRCGIETQWWHPER